MAPYHSRGPTLGYPGYSFKGRGVSFHWFSAGLPSFAAGKWSENNCLGSG